MGTALWPLPGMALPMIPHSITKKEEGQVPCEVCWAGLWSDFGGIEKGMEGYRLETWVPCRSWGSAAGWGHWSCTYFSLALLAVFGPVLIKNQA